MRWLFLSTAAILLIIAGSTFIGCDSGGHDMISDPGNGIVAIASISPADGATGVSTSTSVAITFTGPVDTMSIMKNFHVAGGQAMYEWRDSLSYHGGFGMMNMGMQDHMMAWMDSIQTPGVYNWNEDLDWCEFVPDSALMADADYLCLLYEGDMRDRHGNMMGGSNHQDDGYHMFLFSTEP